MLLLVVIFDTRQYNYDYVANMATSAEYYMSIIDHLIQLKISNIFFLAQPLVIIDIFFIVEIRRIEIERNRTFLNIKAIVTFLQYNIPNLSIQKSEVHSSNKKEL